MVTKSTLTGKTREEYEILVRGPGKFEGEQAYVPYFWDCYLDGGCNDDDGEICTFEVENDDLELFPDLLQLGQRIHLRERDDGFVVEVEINERHRAIVNGFEREGPDLVATGCTKDDGPCGECTPCEHIAEFSSSSCEICNSSLAGGRECVAKIFPGTDKEPIYYSVCVDCYFFSANGDLPE